MLRLLMEAELLSTRTGVILNSIVDQYVVRAVPVPSQTLAHEPELGVSSATVRNEMAYLEKEGYITRPHTSAGSIPTDKGYRYYVESLQNIQLPSAEQRLISHLFHQVEREVEEWLSLAATLLAQTVKNVAVVSLTKSADCKFKHIELVSLQDSLALFILVLHGARVRQKLISFDQPVSQLKLTTISTKLNAAYTGLSRRQISAIKMELPPTEQQITDYLLEVMQAEDEQGYEESSLDGLHYTLSQPEFAHSERFLALMELVEHRSLLKAITPARLNQRGVHVIIGKENKEGAIQEYSVVLSRYGIPGEAIGTIGVVGPTRMPYARTIPTVAYLSYLLSEMVAGLYGRERGND